MNLVNVRPNGETNGPTAGWNPRLFRRDLVVIKGAVWEWADYKTPEVNSEGKLSDIATANSYFLHFIPDEENRMAKFHDWYSRIQFGSQDSTRWNNPSETPSYPLWKMPNPRVLRRYGIEMKKECQYLRSIGLMLHPEIGDRLERPFRRFFTSMGKSLQKLYK
ncbi:hypothetical protein HYT55_04825 [Candidatus Woesearchaeota archaeon]|nr:hypothetical protein [Candidatus Woesearchaeota archaeon]